MTLESYTEDIVRRLIDRWNVGIKEGQIAGGIEDSEIPKIQNILQPLGIVALLENVRTHRSCPPYNLKFIMTEVTDKTIKYPF